MALYYLLLCCEHLVSIIPKLKFHYLSDLKKKQKTIFLSTKFKYKLQSEFICTYSILAHFFTSSRHSTPNIYLILKLMDKQILNIECTELS